MKAATSLLLFWTWISQAAIPDNVKQQVDLRIKHQLNASIALAVFEAGQTDFYVKGWQDKALELTANEHTVYEIGSISKTFTGLLLAKLASDNHLNINDPVEQHWPTPFQLRDAQGSAITLQQLSSHVSGLPRLPNNLPLFSDDPYANYDRGLMLEALANIKPGTAGTQYAYSNLAVGLLGETLANLGGAGFNQLIEQHILEPLALKNTYLTLEAVPAEHLATGYANGLPATPWRFKALAAAGSIRSTITDLLHYGVAYLNPPDDLQPAMQLATRTHYQQDRLQVGLGWHIRDGVYWHNGGTGGFRSMLMIDPEQQKVVAAITNDNQQDVEDLAVHLMDPQQAMRTHDFPVDIEPAELAGYAGTYQQVEGDRQISLQMIDEVLYFTAPKQARQQLVYVGQDAFVFKMIKVKIELVRDQQGDISSLVLHGWGTPQTYQKVNQS